VAVGGFRALMRTREKRAGEFAEFDASRMDSIALSGFDPGGRGAQQSLVSGEPGVSVSVSVQSGPTRQEIADAAAEAVRREILTSDAIEGY
jgi:hypothetical protein